MNRLKGWNSGIGLIYFSMSRTAVLFETVQRKQSMKRISSLLDFWGLGCEGDIPIIYIKVPENMSVVLLRKAEI